MRVAVIALSETCKIIYDVRCEIQRPTTKDSEGMFLEGLGVLERQSRAQVWKSILPICTNARDHALRGYSTIVIVNLAIYVSLTDVVQHPRPCV